MRGLKEITTGDKCKETEVEFKTGHKSKGQEFAECGGWQCESLKLLLQWR